MVRKQTHRLLAALLVMLTAMFFTPLATETAHAADKNRVIIDISNGPVVFRSGGEGITYYDDDGKLVPAGKPDYEHNEYIIIGSTTGTTADDGTITPPNTITIIGGPVGGHKITFGAPKGATDASGQPIPEEKLNLSITPGDYTSYYHALELQGSAELHVTLGGEETELQSNVYPAITVPQYATLSINDNDPNNDTNKLIATTSGGSSAGIGASGGSGNCGTITINGGHVTAQGSQTGAGIGGSGTGSAGNITINGGIVEAYGGDDTTDADGAPGIGCGSKGSYGTVTITGGSIYAKGGAANISNSRAPGIVAGEISSDGNTVVLTSINGVELQPESNDIGKTFNAIVWIDENQKNGSVYGSAVVSDKGGTIEKEGTTYPKLTLTTGQRLTLYPPHSLTIPDGEYLTGTHDSSAGKQPEIYGTGALVGDTNNINISGARVTEPLCTSYGNNRTVFVTVVGTGEKEEYPVYQGTPYAVDGDLLNIESEITANKQKRYSDKENWEMTVQTESNPSVALDKVKDVDTYEIHFNHKYGLYPNFTIVASILPKALTDSMVTYSDTYEYGQDNAITIQDQGEDLEVGTDYTIQFYDADEYAENEDNASPISGASDVNDLEVGSYVAIIEGMGNYTTEPIDEDAVDINKLPEEAMANGPIRVDFTVEPASLNNAVMKDLPTGKSYTGRALTNLQNTIDIELNGDILDKRTYTLTYSNSNVPASETNESVHLTQAGIVTVTATAKDGNYTGKAIGRFEIAQATVEVATATSEYGSDASGQPVYSRPYDGTNEVVITAAALNLGQLKTTADKQNVTVDLTGTTNNPEKALTGTLEGVNAGKYSNVTLKNVKLKGPGSTNYKAVDSLADYVPYEFEITKLIIEKPELTVSSKVSTTDSTTFTCTVAINTAPKGAEYEYRMDDGEWQASPEFDQIAPQSKHTFYARAKNNNNMEPANPEDVGVLVYTTPKLPQEAPADFTLQFELDKSGETFTATIPAVEGAVYSFDGENFNKSNTLKKCQPNTEYTGYIRFPETKEYAASEAVHDTQLTPMIQVKTPKISPATTAFYDPFEVSITCATEGATIYYTTDGNYPTETEENKYTGPFTVSEDTPVTAIAVKEGMDDSEEASIDYVYTEYEMQSQVEYTEDVSPSNDISGMLKDDIISALSRAITKDGGGYNFQNIAYYDIRVKVSFDNGESFDYATAANFPEDGVKIVMPYPSGTSQNDSFKIAHMFSENNERLGLTAGEIEMPAPTKTAEGLEFIVHGTSPLAIGWVSSGASGDENQDDQNGLEGDTNGDGVVDENDEPIEGEGNGVTDLLGSALGLGDDADAGSGSAAGGADGATDGSGAGADGAAGNGGVVDEVVTAVKTGDYTNPYFWAPLMLLSALGILIALVRRRRG